MLLLITRNFLQTHTENEQFPIRCTSASINFTFRIFFLPRRVLSHSHSARHFAFREAESTSYAVWFGWIAISGVASARLEPRFVRLPSIGSGRTTWVLTCEEHEKKGSRNANSRSFVRLQSGSRLCEIKEAIMYFASTCPNHLLYSVSA